MGAVLRASGLAAVVAAVLIGLSGPAALAAASPASSSPAATSADQEAAAPAAPAQPADDPAPSEDDSRCGSQGGEATYNGTSDQRDITFAEVNPYKVANYPCDFPADVRGIRIDSGALSLVQAGQLVRTVPLAAGADGVTLEQVVQAVADPSWIAEVSPGVVELRAGLVQSPGTRLTIAGPAVTELRMVVLPAVALVGEGAELDAVDTTVTSWDEQAGAPVDEPVKGRPYIVYKGGGRMDFTGSRLAHLGSDISSGYGVSWRNGTTGTMSDCVVEHNFFGVYTYETQGVTWQDSTFRNNTWYGLDPHTSSSDLVVRNNDVYGNGHHGIIFSQSVTNSVVEGNSVHDNEINGIMMDFLSNDNVIHDNVVTGNGQGIVFAGSGNNDVYGNTLQDNGIGIRASRDGADANHLHDNEVSGGRVGVKLYGGATTTVLTDNTITGASSRGVDVDAPRSTLTGNEISATPVGVRLRTVAHVEGGSITATRTAIDAEDEAFATVVDVPVQGGEPLQVATDAVVHLAGTTYELPRSEEAVTFLEVAGVAVLAFAVASELVHLARRRSLRGLTAAVVSGVPSAAGGERRWAGVHRFVVRPAAPVRGTWRGTAVTLEEVAHEGTTAQGDLRRFRPDIEGLRAVAVVAVVLAHAALGVPGGYVGVDVFFVISGFLITRQLLAEATATGRISFRRFWARRVRRILPAATVVAIATLWATAVWAPVLRRTDTALDGLAAALFGANWRLVGRATDYFDAEVTASPFQHYWSLSVEEQFYLVWPLLLALLLVGSTGLRQRARLVAAVLAVGITASLWASVHLTSTAPPTAYFGTPARAWELALGALIALGALRLARLPRWAGVAAGWLGLTAIATACALYGDTTAYPGLAVALPVLGAGAVIAGGCVTGASGGGVERLLGRRFPRLLGRISYSLYLWHWPLLVLVPYAVDAELDAVQRAAVVLVAVLLAVMTHHLIEQPLRRRRDLVVRPRRALALGVGLVAATVAAALVLAAIASRADDRPVMTASVTAALSTTGTGADLSQALTAAAAATELPADVTPAPAEAEDDFPETHDCQVPAEAEEPKLPCGGFGDPAGTTRAVLLGDSHAGMWLGAVDAVARQQGWALTFLAKSGCPIGAYTDYTNSETGRAGTERCNSWREDVNRAVAQAAPDLVIIASRARPVAAREPGGMQEEVDRLTATGARVVYLTDTPSAESTGSVPECLADHPEAINDCAVPRAVGLGDDGRTEEARAAQAAGAVVVDTAAWFCTATTCPAVVQDVVVYSDTHHITSTYAVLRVPQLSAALTAAFAAPAGPGGTA